MRLTIKSLKAGKKNKELWIGLNGKILKIKLGESLDPILNRFINKWEKVKDESL